MRTTIYYILAIFLITVFFSCTNNESIVHENKLPEVQTFITKMEITEVPTSRSDLQTIKHITFHDSISGEDYKYNMIVYSDSIMSVDLNCDGTGELHMSLRDGKIIGTMDGHTNELTINYYKEGENIIYEMTENSLSRVTYTHLSWWECCTRLALVGDVAYLTLAIPGVGTAVAGAIAVICLDERNRWEVN